MKNIEKHIKNIYANKMQVGTSAELDEKILANSMNTFEKLKNKKSARSVLDMWRIIAKSRITQFAAVVVVASALCWLGVNNIGEPEQQGIDSPVVAVISETPVELMSVISLSITFRDKDMEAVERQLDEAERRVRRGPTERLTIDQLLCELEECEETQEREML